MMIKPWATMCCVMVISCLPALADEAPPEKALRYHEALLKRPANATLYDRFLGAWLDEQSIDALDAFLAARAQASGGADLAILARHHLRRGREVEALAALEQAIAALPDDTTLPFERAKVLLRRLEFEAARKDLARVAAGSDATLAIEASKLIGKSWLREGDSAKAIEAWDALLASHPGDEDLLEDLVETAAAEGEITQAVAYCEKLIAASADPYKKTLRQIRRGDLLAQAGNSDEAVKVYGATLADVGEGAWLEREILAQIIRVFRRQERLDDLQAELAQLAAAHPGRFIIHRELAAIELATGNVDAAVGRFREILQRSPGDRELREAFIRLLTEGGKFDEAATELEKMIELAKDDAAPLLQMADLRHQQGQAPLALAALQKAHKILGDDEPSGLRIASLMLQYGANAEAEALLKQLASAKEASTIPAETLAAEYARTNRKAEALEMLGKIAASADLDTTIRVTNSIAAMGELEPAYAALRARADGFSQEPAFLTALGRAALAANQPAEAIPHAIARLRMANQAADLAESIALATRAIQAADQTARWRESLAKQTDRLLAETCLLAALADAEGDLEEVDRLLMGLTDPLALRFHAAILSRRGDFDAAIATLLRLSETDEGRKAAFFKELSDLQIRAGKHDDALATIERWKQSAPGDKSAWLTGADVLRETGKPDAAVRTMRQAVGRFEGDIDLIARLAALHEEAGQFDDAGALYWRLYDDAGSPADQARWAVNLAKLAVTTGQTDDLEEKFRERAAGNRRAIGPILAQIELARARGDDDKRRDLLMDALRLQPNDVDIRLQIAQLEEQSGNLDRVIDILAEGADADPSNRIRAALAQTCLRNGDISRGLRELRLLSAAKADDVRSLETSAATLAGSGLYEEAIRFHRESLPDGGDARSRYLLAIMLAHDGRETEAVPMLLALLHAGGEINGLPANPNAARMMRVTEQFSSEAKDLITLLGTAQRAFSHVNARNRGGMGWMMGQGGAGTGPFSLPETAEEVRLMAALQLIAHARKSPADAPNIDAAIRAAGVGNPDFIRDLLVSVESNNNDFGQLFAKYPDQPGLLEITLAFSGWFGEDSGNTTPIKPEHLESKSIPPAIRLMGWIRLARNAPPESPVWQSLLEVARDALATEAKDAWFQSVHGIIQMLSSEHGVVLPEIHQESFKTLLREYAAGLTDDEDTGLVRLRIISLAGTPDELVQQLNAEIRRLRENPSSPLSQFVSQFNHMPHRMMGLGETPFILPSSLGMLSLESIPGGLLIDMFTGPDGQQQYGFFNSLPAKDLITLLEKIESPALRAWIAIRADDAPAIESALAATPPARELGDFRQLAAWVAIGRNEYAEAFTLAEEARPAYASKREIQKNLDNTLIAIAMKMSVEERAAITEKLRSILIQCRASLGAQFAPMLSQAAAEFGFEDLAARFTPTKIQQPNARLGPAVLGGAINPRQSRATSLDSLKKFISEDKTEAAAREVLSLFRQLDSSSSAYEISQLREIVTAPVVDQLILLVDPGESRSLTRRLEYADICHEFGRAEAALATLRELLEERPDDGAIAGRMAFLLPPEERETARSLLTKGASSPDFAIRASSFGERLYRHENNAEAFAYIETITTWLEAEDPANLKSANLTWVAYHAAAFFGGGLTESLPDLTELREVSSVKETPDFKTYTALAKRLATAMHRHPAISEAGFRLLNASGAWQFPPDQLDELARQSLICQAAIDPAYGRSQRVFALRIGNSMSSRSDEFEEHSSIHWLIARLDAVENSAVIFPPEYLTRLEAAKPDVARVVRAFDNVKDIESVAALWDSGVIADAGDEVSSSLRTLLLKRIAGMPGVAEFLLEKTVAIPAGSLSQDLMQGGRTSNATIALAALSAAGSADPKTRNAICAAISETNYGKDTDWQSAKLNQQHYMQAYAMEQMIRQLDAPPAGIVAIYQEFHRLGVPISTDSDLPREVIGNDSFKDIAALEAFLESIGWLAGPEKWAPLASYAIESTHDGSGESYKRVVHMHAESLFQSSRLPGSRSELVKHFSNRKPATFGALITAAAMTHGDERSKLAAQAFALDPAAFDKMPADRIDTFAFLLDWISEDAIAKLPKAFRAKQDAIEKQRALEFAKQVEDFLKNPGRQGHEPLYQSSELAAKLAATDMEKAVVVFLEGERRSTAALATARGRNHSMTSDGYQIARRDSAFRQVLQQLDTSSQRLDFYQRIINHPDGGRFSLTGSPSDGPLLFTIGSRLYSDRNGSTKQMPAWLQGIIRAAEMPEPLRKDALAAIGTYLIGHTSHARSIQSGQSRSQIAAAKDLSADAAASAALIAGIIGWQKDDAATRQTTLGNLRAFLEDATIHPASRYQFAVIALQKSPGPATDPAVASALADLFEHYANTGRSVVNPLAMRTMKLVSITPVDPATAPMMARINSTFWKNAGAPVPAGHSDIPPATTPDLFLAAAFAGDDANANRVLAAARPTLQESPAIIARLIQVGLDDLAKRVMPPREVIYRRLNAYPPLPYDRQFEEKLNAFRASQNISPFDMLRLEAQFKGDAPYPSGSNMPEESEADREIRLAQAYRENPPEELHLRIEILASLIRDSHTTAILLKQEILALRDELDLAKALGEWHRGEGDEGELKRQFALAQSAAVIFRQAAFLDLLDGNPASLVQLADIVAAQPDNPPSRYSGSIQKYLPEFVDRLTQSAPVWLCEAVASGKTDALPAAFDAFATLALKAQTNREFNNLNLYAILSVAEFCAHWNTQGQRFDELLGKMKKHKSYVDGLMKQRRGLLHYATTGKNHLTWNHESFRPTRLKFLTTVLCRPELAAYFGDMPIWIKQTADYGFADEFLQLAANPPEGVLPNVLPVLLDYGKQNPSPFE